MKATFYFGLVVIAIVVVCGIGFGIAFSSAADRSAIEVSGVVAIVVQLFAFSIARLTAQKSFLGGWVTGVALRFVTLIGFALVGVKALGMPAPAALLSLVTFLFISTLVEPKFLTL